MSLSTKKHWLTFPGHNLSFWQVKHWNDVNKKKKRRKKKKKEREQRGWRKYHYQIAALSRGKIPFEYTPSQHCNTGAGEVTDWLQHPDIHWRVSAAHWGSQIQPWRNSTIAFFLVLHRYWTECPVPGMRILKKPCAGPMCFWPSMRMQHVHMQLEIKDK